MFAGHAVLEGGYLYANEQPGLGIDIDEGKAAAMLDGERVVRHKFSGGNEDRRADGSVVRP
jgi:mannonate dehydratase